MSEQGWLVGECRNKAHGQYIPHSISAPSEQHQDVSNETALTAVQTSAKTRRLLLPASSRRVRLTEVG